MKTDYGVSMAWSGYTVRLWLHCLFKHTGEVEERWAPAIYMRWPANTGVVQVSDGQDVEYSFDKTALLKHWRGGVRREGLCQARP